MTFINNDFREGDDELIDKFLQGKLTKTESIAFEERLKSEDFKKKLEDAELIAGSAKFIALKDKLDMLKDLEDSLGQNNQSSDN